MKIIDIEVKGQTVRFYYGKDDVFDYWGDDWNDAPYEHNAGEVYEKYVEGYVDVAFDFNAQVLTPENSYVFYSGNSPWSKQDMKNRAIPCLVVVPSNGRSYCYEENFVAACIDKNAVSFFFEDPVPSDESLGKLGQILKK